MAVEPGLLDIGDGLGSSGDAWDAAEPPNKPIGGAWGGFRVVLVPVPPPEV